MLAASAFSSEEVISSIGVLSCCLLNVDGTECCFVAMLRVGSDSNTSWEKANNELTLSLELGVRGLVIVGAEDGIPSADDRPSLSDVPRVDGALRFPGLLG